MSVISVREQERLVLVRSVWFIVKIKDKQIFF